MRPSGDGYIALSNMPEASAAQDSPSPGKTEVTFEKSVPMVSYLAIFVVCDFEYLESSTPDYNIPFRLGVIPENGAANRDMILARTHSPM